MANQMNPQLTSAQVTADFLKALLAEAGMDTVSPEAYEQMYHDLEMRLNDRLFGSVIINLPEEKVTELRKMTEAGTAGEELQNFIDANLPNAAEVFSQAMMSFRNDYLGVEA